jgi:hypothetical protein
MRKSKVGVLSIIALLLLSLSVSLAAAQYGSSKTVEVTIGSDGVFTATELDIGVSYVIEGRAGAVGTVTASVYGGNPQATAVVPSGVSLSHFIVISFDMSGDDFTRATVTVSYSDNDVANLVEPLTVYKYLPSNDSYVELPTTVDAASKTLTVTLIGVDDPLLAIGGSAPETSLLSASNWLLVSIGTVGMTLLAMAVVILWRKDES